MIALVRKPMTGTIAANVAAHGVGGINIDSARIPVTDAAYAANASGDRGHADNRNRVMNFGMTAGSANDDGRHPANFLLSHAAECVETPGGQAVDGCIEGCPVRDLDGQSGILTTGKAGIRRGEVNTSAAYGTESRKAGSVMTNQRGDSGGASRFFTTFRYVKKPKGSNQRATVWVPAMECRPNPKTGQGGCGLDPHDPATNPSVASSVEPRDCMVCGTPWIAYQHSTVKPLDIMTWLVRLITPAGGTTLDLYGGTGTTGVAAVTDGFRAVLVEMDPVHVGMIRLRLGGVTGPAEELVRTDRPREQVRAMTAESSGVEPVFGLRRVRFDGSDAADPETLFDL